MQGVCTCHPGWSGAKCSSNRCSSVYCGPEGHGTCRGGKCACSPGFKGDQCQFVDRCEVPIPIVSQWCLKQLISRYLRLCNRALRAELPETSMVFQWQMLMRRGVQEGVRRVHPAVHPQAHRGFSEKTVQVPSQPCRLLCRPCLSEWHVRRRRCVLLGTRFACLRHLLAALESACIVRLPLHPSF